MVLGPLRRFLPGGQPAQASAVDRGAPAPTTGGSTSVPAWRRLPVVARTIGPAPLVARTRSYERELSTGRPFPLALQALGH